MSNIKNPTRIQVSDESLDNTKDLEIAKLVKEHLEELRKKEKEEKAKQGQNSGE